MSQADVDRLVKALEQRGGQVSIQDPRVSQVQTWLIGLVGLGVIMALGWLATSVDRLNRNFERITVMQDYMERRLTALERKP